MILFNPGDLKAIVPAIALHLKAVEHQVDCSEKSLEAIKAMGLYANTTIWAVEDHRRLWLKHRRMARVVMDVCQVGYTANLSSKLCTPERKAAVEQLKKLWYTQDLEKFCRVFRDVVAGGVPEDPEVVYADETGGDDYWADEDYDQDGEYLAE